jgi:SAM-dependent methyltransferase
MLWPARRASHSSRRVLDVGCGTGTLLRSLAERHAAFVVDVDSSSAMIDEARKQLPRGSSAHLARAEKLPFADCSFDAAFVSMSVQHFDRPRAFAEILRVLTPAGSFAISTTDAETHSSWAARFFPSYQAIERERFPSEAELREDLLSVGFRDVACERLQLLRRYDRETALAKLRQCAYSTLALMGRNEYETGVCRAEAELEDVVRSTLTLMVISARNLEKLEPLMRP